MVICGLIALLLVLWWVFAHRTAKTKYLMLGQVDMAGLRFRKLHAPFIGLIERLDLLRKFPMFIYRVQHSIQRAYGPKHVHEKMMLFLAEMFVYSWLALIGGAVMTLGLEGQLMGIAIGFMLAIIIPFAQLKDLHEKVKLREQDILMELPEFLNKVVLLVGAGETVQKAIIHCTDRKQSSDHPLYIELRQMIAEWNSGFSFQQAFEQFSKRCGVQEVSIFTTTVLLNFRRGGNDFVLSLRELSRVLWEKRKSLSRTKGEQASSKLVFPMVIIFLVIVIMVGAPSFMTMNL